MRTVLIVAGSALSWATVAAVAVLQWTGRWQSWATRDDAPGYDLVNAVFGISPLPPLILIANVVLVLVGFGVFTTMRFDLGTPITAGLSMGMIALAIYIYLRQPRWAIPPWLRNRQSRR